MVPSYQFARQTPEDIGFAVDCYRARWTIEEFFQSAQDRLSL
jgi:hypothetical protein